MNKNKMLKLLKEIEFSVIEGNSPYLEYHCPYCGKEQNKGHARDCLLSECLKELKSE